MTPFKYLLLIIGIIVAIPASAYIGPGAGISFLGSLFSTLFVILLTIGSILFWPLRYMWKRLKRLKKDAKLKNNIEDTANTNTVSPQQPDNKSE